MELCESTVIVQVRRKVLFSSREGVVHITTLYTDTHRLNTLFSHSPGSNSNNAHHSVSIGSVLLLVSVPCLQLSEELNDMVLSESATGGCQSVLTS